MFASNPRFFIALCYLLFAITSTICHANEHTPRSSVRSFDPRQDLLLCQLDHQWDPDDNQCVAAIGCLLAHSDFKNVKAHGIMGAGSGGNTVTDGSTVFDTVFGEEGKGWTFVRGVRKDKAAKSNSPYWGNAIEQVIRVISNHLQTYPSAHIWIAEGGQSDFTIDYVAKMRKRNAFRSFDFAKRMHLVQHSVANEKYTDTPEGIDYLKRNLHYIKIDDGNGRNATPDFESNGDSWDRKPVPRGTIASGRLEIPFHQTLHVACRSPKLNLNETTCRLWKLSHEHIQSNPNGRYSRATYSAIPGSWNRFPHDRLAFDFSDAVETTWILSPGTDGTGCFPAQGADGVVDFCHRFVLTDKNPMIDGPITLRLEAEADISLPGGNSIIVGGKRLTDKDASGGGFVRPLLKTENRQTAAGFPVRSGIENRDLYQPFECSWAFEFTKPMKTNLAIRFRTFPDEESDVVERKMQVTIDGSTDKGLTLNSDGYSWQQRTVNAGLLTAGTHVITLTEADGPRSNALCLDCLTIKTMEPTTE